MRSFVMALVLGGLVWAQGTELVYKMNPEQAAVVRKRLDKFGLKDVKLGAVGDDKFALHIPAKDKARLKQIKQLVTMPGKLEFRITVEPDTELFDTCWDIFQADIDASVKEEQARHIKDLKGHPHGLRWMQVKGKVLERRAKRDKRGVHWMLVKLDDINFTGAALKTVVHRRDTEGYAGQYVVVFDVKKSEQAKLARLTAKVGDYMAIILDGRLRSAPQIQATLTNNGQITGGYSEDEARVLAAILNAGSMDKPPELVEKK